MNYKDYEAVKNCKTIYKIDYITKSGRGHIEVKTLYYQKYITKFCKLLKDVKITSFTEETL